MNDYRGVLPQKGTTPSFSDRAITPVHPGLKGLGPAAEVNQDARFGPEDIWRTLRKWWWLIAATTVAAVMAAIALSLIITPEYRAEVTLEINPEGVQVMEKMGDLQPVRMGDQEFMTTQAGLLRSETLAERVSRSMGLANIEYFANQEAGRPDREAMAASYLLDNMAVTQARDSRLLKISVDSPDPGLAANIANSYADNFIQSNLERKYEATSYARKFLEQRLASTKARLEQSERDLVAYAQRQGIINIAAESTEPGSRSEQSIDAASLVQLNESLSTARAQRIEAEQRYRQSQGNRSTTTSLGNPTIQALSQQRAELQAEYADKLNLYQPDFPLMVQLRTRIEALGKELGRESGNVSGALRSEYAAAAGRERALEARVNGLKESLLNLRARSIQYTILQREVDTNRSIYDALLQRFKEVGVAGGVGTNHISIIDRARVPQSPFKPNLPLNIALGLLAGLLLGLGAAFAIEWIDDTVKTPEDVKTKLGITPLGVIPIAPAGSTVMEHLADRRSPISEAYQSVRTALQFSTDHGVPRSLLVTSSRASEGKSSTTLALAKTLASLGSSVLIIDADLRKPTFRGPESSTRGLAMLLAGSDEIRQSLHETEVENLFLLAGGSIPPNPAELLATGRFAAIMAEVREWFDYVVVDGPPVLGLADAPLLSSVCEGTLMVIEAGAIRRAAARNAVERLRASDARIMGGILSKFNAAKSGYGYGYGYGSYDLYAYEEGTTPKKQIELLKSS